MSTNFDAAQLLNQSYQITNVENQGGARPGDISLRNGIYTVDPATDSNHGFFSPIIDASGGVSSNEPEDGQHNTRLVVTQVIRNPVNTQPYPSDPPIENTLVIEGFKDQNVNDPYIEGGAFVVIGVDETASGQVNGLLLERWTSFDPTTGRGYFQNSASDNTGNNYLILSATNFYSELPHNSNGSIPGNSNHLPGILTFAQVTPVVTCFAAGTRIASPAGEAAVETLRPSDAVLTAAGATRRIVWTGSRRIDCARHPEPELVWPVRIAADAFGPGAPARDLYLSPDHAVMVDGVLIPVRLLLNGGSIAQVARPSVTYHHIELEAHDVILAENLPAETYLDTGNRALLDERVAVLRPDFASSSAQAERAARSCAPLATEQAQVRPIWLRLAARSATLAPAVIPALAKAG